MKQNRLKKIVLIAAITAALQPATSQCFSWGNLFAGYQSKVSGLLAAAQANRTKAALIVGGTSIVVLALGTCWYKWFFSKKDETPIKEAEYKVVYKDENNGEDEYDDEQQVSNDPNKIPPAPPAEDLNKWKPNPSSQKNIQVKVDKKETSKKSVFDKKPLNLGFTFDPSTVKLRQTGNIENLNNKKPKVEDTQTDFRNVLLKNKQPLVNQNFVPKSQYGNSSTSDLIKINKSPVPTNNAETPK